MKQTRWVAAFDVHGNKQCPGVVKAFHRFCREFKPHRRIIGGDLFDFAPWRGGATEFEKGLSVLEDVNAGFEFIDKFRPTDFLLGNHDLRLWKMVDEGKGTTKDYAVTLLGQFNARMREHNCRVYPHHIEKGVMRLGPLNLLHGFYAGDGACKRHAQTYGPCVFGHIHAADHVVIPCHGRRMEAWSSPCLAERDLGYNDRTPSTMRYQNGWVYGIVTGRSYHVEVAVVDGGNIVVADRLKIIAA